MEDKEDSMLNWVNPHSWVRIKDGIEYYFPTLAEIYSKYSVDGDFGVGDKGLLHSYIPEYEKLLAPYRDKEITLLEIGVNQGHSLKMWREYFSKAKIYGVDLWSGCKDFLKEIDVEIIISDATTQDFADKIKFGLDIVVDDGAHFESMQIATYELLKSKMNRDSIYVIEDILDLESSCSKFEALGFEIIDLRNIKKNRFDDVLCVKYF